MMMLNNSGFDLWADGYDKSVGVSDEGNVYPFAGYKKVMNRIFGEIMEHGGGFMTAETKFSDRIFRGA